MEHEKIISAINRLHETLKGTKFEKDVIETKKEITEIIDNAELQAKADAEYEEYLDSL